MAVEGEGSPSLRQRRATLPSVSLTNIPSTNGNAAQQVEITTTTPIPSRRKFNHIVDDDVVVVKPPDPVRVLSDAQSTVAKDEGRKRKIIVRVTSGALMVRRD
jgi:hypothetical protein